MSRAAERAHVDTLRAMVMVLRPALQRLPAIEQVNKAQRATSVLVRSLDELYEALR